MFHQKYIDDNDSNYKKENEDFISKRNTGSKKTEVHVLSGSSNFQNFVLHTSTDLHETDDDYLFYPDGNNLYMIKRRGGSNTTEVHILNV